MESFSGRVGFIFFISMLLSLVCIISSVIIVLYYLYTLILIFFIISMIVLISVKCVFFAMSMANLTIGSVNCRGLASDEIK